jgi:hypothetical protein
MFQSLDDAVFPSIREAIVGGAQVGAQAAAQFVALINQYSTLAYINYQQIMSLIAQVYVTSNALRPWACASLAWLMAEYLAEDDPTPYHWEPGAISIAFDVACSEGAHVGHH